MPSKRNQKPKGKGQPKRKNPAPINWNKPESAKQKRSRARKNAGPDARSTQGRQLGQVGNAILARTPRIGLPDLMAHMVSWVCGSVYVGNGTLGATNGVYFLDAVGTKTVSQPVPVLGSDTAVGASYVLAIEKLYRRKRIRKLWVTMVAVQSSTTNNLTLTAAPIRGPPDINETGQGKTDTTAAISQASVMSLTDAKTVDSFEDLRLDLTPFIAGGAGGAQNEFAIGTANNGVIDSVTNQVNLLGICPAGFVLGGTSTVAALQGTNTHQIIVSQIVDYLDFVGAVPVVSPEGLAAGVWPYSKNPAVPEEREARRGRLLSELSALARDDKDKRSSSLSPVRHP